jgi:fucose 4-O-acetylase-like acetyltransferase
LARAALVGAAMVAAWMAWDEWMQAPTRLGMKRDFILNNHWTPRGPSVLWVLGMLGLTLGLSYWIMQRRGWTLPWLVTLGQAAMFLYFVHQIIAFTLVGEWLGWRFNDWPRFYLANGVFVLALVALGSLWRRLKRAVFDQPVMLRWTRARARP